jgi:hypothetical protein
MVIPIELAQKIPVESANRRDTSQPIVMYKDAQSVTKLDIDTTIALL